MWLGCKAAVEARAATACYADCTMGATQRPQASSLQPSLEVDEEEEEDEKRVPLGSCLGVGV